MRSEKEKRKKKKEKRKKEKKRKMRRLYGPYTKRIPTSARARRTAITAPKGVMTGA